MTTTPSISTLRRKARKQGLELVGTGARNLRDHRYGRFYLADPYTNTLVCHDCPKSAEEIHEYLEGNQ